MQLEDVLNNVRDQERGRDLEIVDPFTGEPTGMVFTIVGPDSDTAHRARIALSDELAEMADADGRVSAENREKARRNCLAAHVIRWNVMEGAVDDISKPVPFTTKNLLTLLKVQWIEQQVDAFAADRRNFRPADVERVFKHAADGFTGLHSEPEAL